MRARGGGFRTARTARRCSASDARPCAASSRRSGSYETWGDMGRYGEIWGDTAEIRRRYGEDTAELVVLCAEYANLGGGKTVLCRVFRAPREDNG